MRAVCRVSASCRPPCDAVGFLPIMRHSKAFSSEAETGSCRDNEHTCRRGALFSPPPARIARGGEGSGVGGCGAYTEAAFPADPPPTPDPSPPLRGGGER